MDFRTTIDAPKFPFSISYETPTLFCGSCFTENIGSILQERKLPVMVNPFGVVYNPISVKIVIESIIKEKLFTESDLNFMNGLWFSYKHHSSFSSPNKEECLDLINSNLIKASAFAKKMNCLVITFGTARVYYLKTTSEPVANCHKTPAKEFENRLLDVTEIVEEWSELIDTLIKANPDLKILFTVSPVRHWKDGAVGNQISKSILHVAIHQLVDKYPNNAYYFPAYEIQMDDLRDYRFYSDDMLHPSKFAIEYIWERFRESLLDIKTIALISEIDKILQAVNHRPFNPNTTEHKAFIKKILEKIQKVNADYPGIDFEKEKAILLNNMS